VEMARDPRLMADVLSADAPDEPGAAELTAYARNAAGLLPADRARVERYLAASPAHRDRFLALAPADWTLVGSCLCGEVRYVVQGPIAAIGHCHCRRCRKAHGAAFGSFALVDDDAFAWRQGADHLARFGGAEDQVLTFCSRCGTTLTGNAPPGQVALAVATLDVDPIARPALHASVGERAPWFEITDEVAQLTGPFPRFGRHDPRDEETP
jgi:hypothetical protein